MTVIPKVLVRLFCLFIVTLSFFSQNAFAEKKYVTAGYVNLQPYHYVVTNNDGFHKLTGLDVHLFNLIFSNIKVNVQYQEMLSQDIFEQLKSGKIDITSTSRKNFGIMKYAYYSKPFRRTQDAFYVRTKDARLLHYRNLRHFFSSPRIKTFKFGVVRGQTFSDDKIRKYLRNPRVPSNIVFVNSYADNINNLLSGKIDGFFGDEIAIENLLWYNKLSSSIVRYPLPIDSKQVYVLFSKASMTKKDVAAFNKSMDQMRVTGKVQQIKRRHIVPMMIAIMTETKWYHAAELLGVISFALSGVILAKKANFDFFGALFIASLPASAGGIMRDVMLDRQPIGIVRTPVYLIIILLTVFTVYMLVKFFYLISEFNVIQRLRAKVSFDNLPDISYYVRFFDVFAQSAFVITGVMVCVETHVTPLWFWAPIFATLSSCGGGTIRDFILGNGFNRTFLYETLAFWGFALALFIIWRTENLNLHEVLIAVVITMLGLIASRIITLRFGWRTNNFWSAPFKMH